MLQSDSTFAGTCNVVDTWKRNKAEVIGHWKMKAKFIYIFVQKKLTTLFQCPQLIILLDLQSKVIWKCSPSSYKKNITTAINCHSSLEAIFSFLSQMSANVMGAKSRQQNCQQMSQFLTFLNLLRWSSRHIKQRFYIILNEEHLVKLILAN